jgi:hypothetical protein
MLTRAAARTAPWTARLAQPADRAVADIIRARDVRQHLNGERFPLAVGCQSASACGRERPLAFARSRPSPVLDQVALEFHQVA